MASQNDLTSLSTTFPSFQPPQISRDNYVSLLHNMFGPERKVITVQGPTGAGKTTLLAQFAKSFPSQCFSFFIGTTLITSHPRYFLLDMCDQMGLVLNKSTEGLDKGDTDQIRQVFHDLLRKVAQIARKSSTPYYFVIDGLEFIAADNEGNTVIDLLPAEPLPNIYLLLSSEPNRQLPFPHYKWDIPFFSLTETERYLESLSLSKEEIQRVHKISEGMPGYSGAIYRLINTGVSFEELSARLPRELSGLFEFEWKRMNLQDEDLSIALAILAYSREALNISELGQITSRHDENLKHAISKLSFLRIDADRNTINFATEAHKQFTSDRLKTLREKAESLLVEYYSRDPYAKSSLALLPSLLAKSSRYEQLKSLLTADYMTRALTTSHDIGLLRQTLQVAGNQAYRQGDWETLPKFTLASSLLRSISIKPVAESEVRALLELGDYDQAFEIAYQTLLPADRLQLLARVCSRMQQIRMSVPENMLTEIEQIALTLDPVNLQDRSIKIAATLFELLPQVAISIVEKSANGADGERSLDLARATLALSLRADSKEVVNARIADPALRDFARAYSPRAAQLTAEEVIVEADKIKDTSGKLFLLNSWCKSNKTTPSAGHVIERAIDVIGEDSSYAPPIRLLRQLAEPLHAIDLADAAKLVERLNLLKSTSITEPVEEVIRFDLLIATLESKQSREKGINRLLEVYFSLDNIESLDIRCYSLARLLVSLPKIDPEDSQRLNTELEKRLCFEYATLLEQSADHLFITRRMLQVLTTYNIELAIEFARKMNKPERRDKALQEILRAYTIQKNCVSLSTIERILNCISERERYEYALVLTIDNLNDSGAFISDPDLRTLFEKIPSIQNPHNRSYAFAFALNAMTTAGDITSSDKLYQHLVQAWESVDAQWERVELGFNLITTIAGKASVSARALLERIQSERKISSLAEEFFTDIYINCIRLALRAFSGLLAYAADHSIYKDQLLGLIKAIPSVGHQCQLFADLALRHFLAGRDSEFVQLVENDVLPTLEACPNRASRQQTLEKIGACIFEYDEDWALDQFSELSRSTRDKTLGRIVTYLITHALPDDPVELDSLKTEVDRKTARRVCSVIDEISQDHEIYSNIHELVSALVRPDPYDKKREVCKNLIERDALDIVQRLEDIIDAKLPDPIGIPHKGYVISSKSAVNRLRAAAEKRSKKSSQVWIDLAREVRSIDNVADRVISQSWVGRNMYSSNLTLGHTLIQEAEKLIPSIPNVYDQAGRFYGIARVWKDVREIEAARSVLGTAMSLIKTQSWDESRDDISEKIIKVAHSIDPEFASSLTPLMENPVKEHNAMLEISARNLQRNPQKIQSFREKGQDAEQMQHILGRAAWELLGSLNSGSVQARHPKEVGEWLYAMLGGHFENVFPVAAWSIQNTLLQTRRIEPLTAAYQSVHDSLQLCTSVSHVLLGIRSQATPAVKLALPDNVLLFQAGSRSDVLFTLQEWLRTSANEYIKIYDPYFSAAELDILMHVAPDIQVFIVTSWKAQRGLSPGDRTVEKVYKEAWTSLSKEDPPWTQVTVVGTKSGDSPLHSRFIVTAGAGIGLGTSIGGLGLKDTDLRILSGEEASKIESEFINPQLVPQFRLYKGERLIIYPFLLS